ncbi:histone-fold-containing protein [Microdochium trichocladiopsis]|uniref:DNA polymerase epsilon subunit D n=1 Tax=Microdochium trichocladiopsis TaxID=1682393 RepID=A0A9P9BN43_9PEZI|nr:histone-fold-containing protein [Microdochium trichocladiopsis]KAH7026576.1 histone-fold-containing protein [Microdochium trichocladiopsis]
MPPRKSDAARRSDVSTATFALIDEPAPATPNGSFVAANSKATTTSHKKQAQQPAASESNTESRTDAPADKEKSASRESGAVTVEDLALPKSIITRLSKGVLPSNTQIQANAILAMSKSATIFINYLADAANDHTIGNGKKTIMPADVFAALEDTEFGFFRERLEAEYAKFNETQTSKRNTYRQKLAAKKAGTSGTGTGDSQDPDASTVSAAADADTSGVPRSKKHKPNGPDDSQMDVDQDATEEFHDATDAESEPDKGEDDDEDDEEEEEEEEEDAAEEDEDDDDDDEQEMHDALEEREPEDEQDEALDDGAESE